MRELRQKVTRGEITEACAEICQRGHERDIEIADVKTDKILGLIFAAAGESGYTPDSPMETVVDLIAQQWEEFIHIPSAKRVYRLLFKKVLEKARVEAKGNPELLGLCYRFLLVFTVENLRCLESCTKVQDGEPSIQQTTASILAPVYESDPLFREAVDASKGGRSWLFDHSKTVARPAPAPANTTMEATTTVKPLPDPAEGAVVEFRKNGKRAIVGDWTRKHKKVQHHKKWVHHYGTAVGRATRCGIICIDNQLVTWRVVEPNPLDWLSC
jgi:hypothetical protein